MLDWANFWAKVDIQAPDTCWIWTGSKSHRGYGQITVDRKTRRAHRLIYEQKVGTIPAGMFVCHKCDTPSCVNPAHLFLGTCSDNNRDMQKKGRGKAPKGSAQHAAKLSEQDVRAIKMLLSEGFSKADIARKFAVSRHAVSKIACLKNWRHVQAH